MPLPIAHNGTVCSRGAASKAVARGRALLAAMLAAIGLLAVPSRGLGATPNIPLLSSAVLSNLLSIDVDLTVGDPRTRVLGEDGPKGIGVADFNRDGTNDLVAAGTDGSLTVYAGLGQGVYGAPFYLHVPTNASGLLPSLRGVVAADLNGDGWPDLAVAAPFEGWIHVFTNVGVGTIPPQFAAAPSIQAWRGVRDLAVADLIGDGRRTLLAAGPNAGLRAFQINPDGSASSIPGPPELNYFTGADSSSFPKPVYSLHPFRPDATSALEYVAVTHAETNTVWLLRFAPPNGWILLPGITNEAPSHDLDIGPLRSRSDATVNDLVTVQRDSGTLTLWAGSATGNGPFRFLSSDPFQTLDVAGGPRSVRIADINQDGWNDLVVGCATSTPWSRSSTPTGTFTPPRNGPWVQVRGILSRHPSTRTSIPTSR